MFNSTNGTQQHLQHQHKNDTGHEAGDKDDDAYDLDEDDKKEIKAIRRAVRALAHKMMMQNNMPMPMSTSNNNMPMTDAQRMQMMQNNPQDMDSTDMMVGADGDSLTVVDGDSTMGADGDSTMVGDMQPMQQQGQMVDGWTNPQMMSSEQMMQQPHPYQANNMMPHPNAQMMHTQPQQQQQHRIMMMGSQQMMNPHQPNMMMTGQQQHHMGPQQQMPTMTHQNPNMSPDRRGPWSLGARHAPSTPKDVQLSPANATNNETASNMTDSNIAQFNTLSSRLQRSLYATVPQAQSNNANQQQSQLTPNQTSFNSQAPTNSTNSTSADIQQGLNTTLLQDQQNGTNSKNSSQVSEDNRPVHPKLHGVAHMFRNIF